MKKLVEENDPQGTTRLSSLFCRKDVSALTLGKDSILPFTPVYVGAQGKRAMDLKGINCQLYIKINKKITQHTGNLISVVLLWICHLKSCLKLVNDFPKKHSPFWVKGLI